MGLCNQVLLCLYWEDEAELRQSQKQRKCQSGLGRGLGCGVELYSWQHLASILPRQKIIEEPQLAVIIAKAGYFDCQKTRVHNIFCIGLYWMQVLLANMMPFNA